MGYNNRTNKKQQNKKFKPSVKHFYAHERENPNLYTIQETTIM